MLGHVERMTNEILAKTIYKWKPNATRPKGRPRVRWEDDVRNDLRKMGVTNWKQRTQERKQRKEIIEQAKNRQTVVELKKKEEEEEEEKKKKKKEKKKKKKKKKKDEEDVDALICETHKKIIRRGITVLIFRRSGK